MRYIATTHTHTHTYMDTITQSSRSLRAFFFLLGLHSLSSCWQNGFGLPLWKLLVALPTCAVYFSDAGRLQINTKAYLAADEVWQQHASPTPTPTFIRPCVKPSQLKIPFLVTTPSRRADDDETYRLVCTLGLLVLNVLGSSPFTKKQIWNPSRGKISTFDCELLSLCMYFRC